jgi:PAS domain S-box-containing protein
MPGRLAADPGHVYRLLVEHGRGLVCIHDVAGTLLFVNPAAADTLGYRPEDLVGTELRQLLHGSVRREFDAYLERIRVHGRDRGVMRLVGRYGQPQVWSYDNVRHQEPGGDSLVLGHAVDVSEERATESKARERSERYRTFIAAAGVGICRFELERSLRIEVAGGEPPEQELLDALRSSGYVAECNDAFAHLYGAGAAAEMIGVPLRNFALFRDSRNLEGILRLIRRRFGATDLECHEVSVSGSPRQFLVSATGVVEEGSLHCLWALLRDITESKRLEAEAQKNRRLLELVQRLLSAQGDDRDELASQICGALGGSPA